MEHRIIEEAHKLLLDDGTPLADTHVGRELIRLARAQIASAQATFASEAAIERNTMIGRRDDMSLTSRIVLLKQPDGDVCVSIVNDSRAARLEFCTPGTGGGRSPRTFAALHALILAIHADNAETPEFSARSVAI
ncbi:hypothetical protein [Paraburkholderia fungorum]|uniref:hypothetical protein n=1 Tax=Paraburkholderia fungorum TaxID=134537 RepID=UPI000FDBE2BA|nr:hypothetical protein [Paraburkholderia fungorum]